MNVINGVPFIKYQLDSIYQFADEIVIVEGAYKKFSHAAAETGRSTDNTIGIIKGYPDPQNKIKLIINPGFYEDRKEMCDELLRHITGDIIWQIDVDEFYMTDTHQFVRKLFETDAQLDLVSFNFVEYFASLDFVISGYDVRCLNNVNRVHRFQRGDTWITQRPPTLGNAGGQAKPIRKKIEGTWLQSKGHVMHHASLVFKDQIESKYQYYKKMWGTISDPAEWMGQIWFSFDNKFNVAGFNNSITYLVKSPYQPVPELSKMFNDVYSGQYPIIQIRGCEDIRSVLESSDYRYYISIAERINYLPHNIKEMKLFSKFGYMYNLISDINKYLDKQTRRFAYNVIRSHFVRLIRKILRLSNE
jgi:hypothetical protein